VFSFSKRSLYRAANGIFEKIGRIVSEKVVITIVELKMHPCIIVCPWSMQFVEKRFTVSWFHVLQILFIKLLQTSCLLSI